MAERLSGVRTLVTPDPDAEDGQCLLFEYPACLPGGGSGLCPARRQDRTRRSLRRLAVARADCFTPYLAEALPEIVPDAKVSFRTLAAERTFWEKAMLLHEETFRPADKPRAIRMARHYYDLWCLISRGVAEKAAAEKELFKRVAEHRQAFFRWSWVDYETLRRGIFARSFLPRGNSHPGGRTTRP